MKKIKYIFLATACLFLCGFSIIQTVDWKITDGYSIRFSSEDPNGAFTKFSGDISFDSTQLEKCKFNLSVDASSISTGNGMKNRHAKSDEWLDVEKYSTIHFVSDVFSKTEKGYLVTGTLDMHGVKKQIVIPFVFENNTFKGSFFVNRLDYKIGKSTGMYGKVSKELKIDFSVPVTEK